MHDAPITSPAQSASTVFGPGGGDTEISIDRAGKVYYSDLAALTSLKMAVWDPKTRTMKSETLTKGKDNANGYDRQWFATWDPANPAAVRKATGYTGPFPVNYLTYTEALARRDCTGRGACDASSFSTDGVSYSDVTSTFSKQNDGGIVIDQQTGAVIQALSVTNDSDVGIAIRTRDPQAPSDPALRKVKIIKAATMPKGTTTGGSVPFPTIAMDADRTIYLAWTTRADVPTAKNHDAWQTFYTYASARSGWTKWAKPVRLSHSPSSSALMPWSVAGSKGRLAVVWYGTSDGFHDPSSEDAHQPWDVYMATVTNADTAHPEVLQQKVTKHPMHYGTICLSGAGCIFAQGNRNLADFFEITMDERTGGVSIVYCDTSNELAQSPPGTSAQIPAPVDGLADHRGAAVVTVLKQDGGIGLLGRRVGSGRKASSRVDAAANNAAFDPVYGGKSIPQMDLRGLSVARDNDYLVFRLRAASLTDLPSALTTTHSSAIQYVMRWTGAPVLDVAGTRNPIYYASVEVGASGIPSFFAGTARAVELCSVSACDPHIIDYPAPPSGGTAVTGRLVAGEQGGDYWEVRVPRSVVGSPAAGSMLESLSGYALARSHSAATPFTNAELEAGVAPVLVDGVCCVDAIL